jgi:hypothetical protein
MVLEKKQILVAERLSLRTKAPNETVSTFFKLTERMLGSNQLRHHFISQRRGAQ